MLTPMIRDLLPVICQEGDNGFLMAADEFDNSDDKYNRAFGRILRNHVNILTYVRMSMPIPLSMAKAMKEDNDLFAAEDRKYINSMNYGAFYSQPLGPYYLRFEASLTDMASNMGWLEAQPIRDLKVNHCSVGTDLQLVLRNHRMQYMQTLALDFSYGGRNKNPSDIGAIVAQLQGHTLASLRLSYGVSDRLGIIKANFQANRSIPKGCELFIGSTRTHVKK